MKDSELIIKRQEKFASLAKDLENILNDDSSDPLSFKIIINKSSSKKEKDKKEAYSLQDFQDFLLEANKFFRFNIDDIVELSVLITSVLAKGSPYQSCYSSNDECFKFFSPILVRSSLESLEAKGYFIKAPWVDSSRTKEPEFTLKPDFLKVLSKFYFDGSSYGSDSLSEKSPVQERPFLNIIDTHMLKYDDIKEIELAMPETTKQLLNKIEDALTGENYTKITKRLAKKNTGNGICISLQGISGTGKTETVYQLARRTKRDIFKYDAVESESSYVGAQANALNAMFDRYNEICVQYEKASQNIPILLLNEADAIFTKRLKPSGNNGAVEREINSLQAELLDKLESFRGILFITTNVPESFDEAMERRFLFKVNFENPDKETQMKIWKLNFSDMTELDVNKLAEMFDMTGGNIANVRKKLDMEYIISGNPYNMDTILEACRSEKKSKNERKIGFGKC